MQGELGWDIVKRYDEWRGGVSKQGRDGKRKVVWEAEGGMGFAAAAGAPTAESGSVGVGD